MQDDAHKNNVSNLLPNIRLIRTAVKAQHTHVTDRRMHRQNDDNKYAVLLTLRSRKGYNFCMEAQINSLVP